MNHAEAIRARKVEAAAWQAYGRALSDAALTVGEVRGYRAAALSASESAHHHSREREKR